MRGGGGGDGDGGGGGGEVRRKEPAMRSIRSAPNNKQRSARASCVFACACGQMHTFVARVNIVWPKRTQTTIVCHYLIMPRMMLASSFERERARARGECVRPKRGD